MVHVMKDKPTRKQAEAAVRTLISWAGDDPDREGLQDTPRRVVSAYEEFFSGYLQVEPAELLFNTFEEIKGYNQMIVVKDIDVTSHCEHHMVPIIGRVHVAYIPDERIVGLSKLARAVEIFARRLQTQETMTMQIAETIDKALKPLGVAVVMNASHQCMTTRGVKKPNSKTITSHVLGAFRNDPRTRAELMEHLRS